MAATAKKRNPQDSTLRNIRASVKRVAVLEARLARLEERVRKLAARIKR